MRRIIFLLLREIVFHAMLPLLALAQLVDWLRDWYDDMRREVGVE